jgi:hypothetical protein
LYSQVAQTLLALTYNGLEELRIVRVECDTTIVPGRSTAEIESAELDAPVYAPGETVKATVWARPHMGKPEKLHVALKLPGDLPEGSYTALLCDEVTSTRADIRANPTLSSPTTLAQVLEGLRVQTAAKRTNLVLRVPIGAHGVASAGQALPDLPGSMVKILTGGRRTGAQTMSRALVGRQKTEWVIQGNEALRFEVRKVRPGSPVAEE